MWFGDEALFSENVCVRDSWHCQVGRGAHLVGVIRGLANPGLRVEGQKVQLHTQPCLEFEVRQLRRGGEDHGV